MSRRRRPDSQPAALNRSASASAAAPSLTQQSKRYLVSTLVVAVAVVWFWSVSNSAIRSAELALSRGDFQEALELSDKELQSNPTSGRALTVAGLSCLALKNPPLAQQYLMRVSQDEKTLIGVVQSKLGGLAFAAGRVSEAEDLFRQSLESFPHDLATLDQLIYLLALEGRTWEARQLIFKQLRAGVINSNYLILISSRKSSLANPAEFAQGCLAAVPNDPLPYLALARQAWRDNDAAKARSHLEKVLQKHPQLVAAHSLLLELLVETGTLVEVEQARARLPPSAEDLSEVWLHQGLWAEKQGQWKAAARCYGEALRRDANLPRANYHLSHALAHLGMHEQAIPFAERANLLTKLQLQIPINLNDLSLEKLRSIVEQLEFLGRDWEAAGWCQLVLLQTGSLPDWARAMQLRLRPALLSSATDTAVSKNPVHRLDLSLFPLPERSSSAPQSVPMKPSINNEWSAAFRDEAASSGLHFTYQNGASSDDSESMFEMNGGGVAVLDYDGDHWPDLFFTQGGRLPPAPFDASVSDQLFRNLGGDQAGVRERPHKQFANVSSQAGIQDVGYGQGITVGDFDNDGFPDLYVGNIGPNQLYHNNGDGTFSDVTAQSGTVGGYWTSSCVFADLNQDGLPDLYVATYLGGDDLGRRHCNKRKHPRCAPLDFSAEQDHLYLNLGDGRFRDVTEISGLIAPDGRGLGVVAGDFDGSHRLSLFVANDMSANFFFRNQTTSPESIRFEEQALLAGLAFDDQGAAKACMGVAAGDANGDGRLDLFVTNFYRQFNDFYVQQPDGSFHDISRQAKLADSSFLMLGWGTQFIDGELDGYPDLILTNGHVHEPDDPQVPYRMPPQYYRNQGNGTFAEIPSPKLGDFFQSTHLGRSLVRLDWNGDGREDVCISHLNEPVALLTNRSQRTGNFLAFRLVGVNSSRDAIGSSIRVQIGKQSWVRQLTAGDGFHASNERRLVFGLGDQTTVDSVEVTWPSGLQQSFQQFDVNQEWLLIGNFKSHIFKSHITESCYDAVGIERWKWTCFQAPFCFCHTRVSSLANVAGTPSASTR